MRRKRIILLMVALGAMSFIPFIEGNAFAEDTTAVHASAWIVQSQQSVEGDAHILQAFQPDTIPAVTLQDAPPWPENAEIVKCNMPMCLVDIPGWSVAVLVGGYNIGQPFLPSVEQGHSVILMNVGEGKVSFGYAALGPSYVVLVPFADGRPEELARLTANIAGYLAQVGLFPDRNSPVPMEWNNQCQVSGCKSLRVALYIFAFAPDRPENAFARFIHYARVEVSK